MDSDIWQPELRTGCSRGALAGLGDGDYGVLYDKLEEILLYIINILVVSLRHQVTEEKRIKIKRTVLLAVFPPFPPKKLLSGGGHWAGFAKLAYSRPDPHCSPLATHTAQSPPQTPLPNPPSQDQQGPGGLNRVEMDRTEQRVSGGGFGDDKKTKLRSVTWSLRPSGAKNVTSVFSSIR